MINVDNITALLSQRVKVIQRIDPCTPRVAPDLIKVFGSDKRALNTIGDGSFYMNPDNLYSMSYLIRQEKESNYLAWDGLVNYTIGDLVRYDDGAHEFIYVARQASLNQIPSWDSDFWETNLSDYLRKMIRDAAEHCISTYIQNVTSENDIAADMKVQPLFQANSTVKEIVSQSGANEFLGVRVRLADVQHIQVRFAKIGIYCTGAQTLPLYLYHSSQTEPIAQFQINLLPTDVNKFVWKDILDLSGTAKDAVVNFFDNSHNTRGVFYFGYYRNDLVLDLVKGYDWRGYFYDASITYYSGDFENWFNQIVPIRFSESSLNKPNIPNIGEFFTGGQTDFIAPFNLKVTASCNYTYPIESNSQMFDEYLLYSTAERILQDIKSGVRKNEMKSKLDDEFDRIMMGVFNENQQIRQGVIAKKEKAEKNLSASLSELDDVCFRRLNIKQIF